MECYTFVAVKNENMKYTTTHHHHHFRSNNSVGVYDIVYI